MTIESSFSSTSPDDPRPNDSFADWIALVQQWDRDACAAYGSEEERRADLRAHGHRLVRFDPERSDRETGEYAYLDLDTGQPVEPDEGTVCVDLETTGDFGCWHACDWEDYDLDPERHDPRCHCARPDPPEPPSWLPLVVRDTLREAVWDFVMAEEFMRWSEP